MPVRIETTDNAVHKALQDAINTLEKPNSLLSEIGDRLIDSTKQRFATSIAPDGSHWLANARSTVEAFLNKNKAQNFGKRGKLISRGVSLAINKRPLNYERGERHPGSLYLDAAEKLGVDVHYVFTATRAGKDRRYARAYTKMLYTFEMLLGLEENRLEPLAKDLVEINSQQGIFEGDEKTPSGIVHEGAGWTSSPRG